jgi:hypothetical protein
MDAKDVRPKLDNERCEEDYCLPLVFLLFIVTPSAFCVVTYNKTNIATEQRSQPGYRKELESQELSIRIGLAWFTHFELIAVISCKWSWTVGQFSLCRTKWQSESTWRTKVVDRSLAGIEPPWRVLAGIQNGKKVVPFCILLNRYSGRLQLGRKSGSNIGLTTNSGAVGASSQALMMGNPSVKFVGSGVTEEKITECRRTADSRTWQVSAFEQMHVQALYYRPGKCDSNCVRYMAKGFLPRITPNWAICLGQHPCAPSLSPLRPLSQNARVCPFARSLTSDLLASFPAMSMRRSINPMSGASSRSHVKQEDGSHSPLHHRTGASHVLQANMVAYALSKDSA